MKKYNSTDLLNTLQANTRQLIVNASLLRAEDPANLLQSPAPGKWSVIQVLEHLNSYGCYYLVEIERSIKKDHPAVDQFSPGWLGDYFTRIMKPDRKGVVANKMKAPKNHRPSIAPDAMPVLRTFIEQQHYLLGLLELAKEKNIGRTRIPISLSKLIRLKLGDTFRFLIAHEQRHFVQISDCLKLVKGQVSMQLINY